ncbi:putative StAR-related lipid transfer protein 10 [Monocercomonoides exilis]|uniref:putative StAR-related lipid transfer protein 10 n=1 Tax=Monocercomonoides exilis TaxID=2049356 RepID=UPI00355AAABE|nr:putative StAR-related lipid transfer protein 10 [Monocercomonoides exilis]|eukprot:MONOS_4526.1-p1 / transcript=MONOS_4526.1 / gene=MONOS_4526 / organism=Monocercomonoides_exilis_PA203 / gene_product=unspecified product / transcript_product=unspecified product / location=Mono_scaffold00121:72562-73604(+) / protein_length=279 / sequence_SO=supercontig / SO=protein_coding / is_pseudo=false
MGEKTNSIKMIDNTDIIQSFLDEINVENRNTSPNSWVFVSNLNGVDIFHKTFDKHIGILGEAFLPDVNPSTFFNFLRKAGNRVSFDKSCVDSNDVDKLTPESDVIRYYFKLWPAAPRDVVVKRCWKELKNKSFILAETSITHSETPEVPTYLRSDVAIAGYLLSRHRIPKGKSSIDTSSISEDVKGKVESDFAQSSSTTPTSPVPSISPSMLSSTLTSAAIGTEEEVEDYENYIYGTKYTYLVVVDPMAWVPETVLRKWSLEYPQILKAAAEEMKSRGR